MNYQQLKYFNTLDRNKQEVYFKRLTTLETNILSKLLTNDPIEADEHLLDRFNKLTNYPKEISLEANLDDLDNLLEVEISLAEKEREIANKRRIIRGYINEILDKTIK